MIYSFPTETGGFVWMTGGVSGNSTCWWTCSKSISNILILCTHLLFFELPWRWRQQVPPNWRCISTKLHSMTLPKSATEYMNVIYALIYVTCNIFIETCDCLSVLEWHMKRQSYVNMCKLQVCLDTRCVLLSCALKCKYLCRQQSQYKYYVNKINDTVYCLLYKVVFDSNVGFRSNNK